MKFCLNIVLIASLAVSAAAQHEGHPKNTPARLLPGMGKVNHPVNTSNPRAQRFFNQGLALVYGFNHEEAARSFLEAARLDQKLGIAYWGYALAVGFNYNEPSIDQERMKKAVEALATARSLVQKGLPEEKALIEALSRRFTTDPNANLKNLQIAYSQAMADVAHNFPDDPDAAVLYADSLMNINPWQLWTSDGKPAEGTETIVSVLEGVLRRFPSHVGANHLYIHAVEASRNPAKANRSAAKLPSLAPAAGHLVHMPGHIYLRTGEYNKSAVTNVAAANVDRKYLKSAGDMATYSAMYFNHNLDFQVVSYAHLGNYRKASKAAVELESSVARHLEHMPMAASFLVSPLSYPVRFGRWEQVLNHPEPAAPAAIHTFWQFLRAYAYARLGKIDEARKARENFRSELAKIPADATIGLNGAMQVLEVGSKLLDARITHLGGDKAAAIDLLRKAVAAQDALSYDEPPDWFYSVRESLGAALLENGEVKEAESVFKEDLRLNPGSGRSLFGLSKTLEKEGRRREASRVYLKFQKAWVHADSRLKLSDLW